MYTDDIIDAIAAGEVGVIPTDTLYGLVGSALDPDAVSRIYELKRRNPDKPLIVLIADVEDVERFGVVLSAELREQLERYWPGPYSIVLPTIDDTFSYLDRGTRTIAFRLPDDEELRDLLRQTGPLVAPSANVEGDAPARTISHARAYFGSDAAFYVDGGEIDREPSTVMVLDESGETAVLRAPNA